MAFGIAVTAAGARALIHLRIRKPPRLDDYLLLFACITLTASTVLLYYGTSSIYASEALALNPAKVSGGAATGPTPTGLDPEQQVEMLRKVILFQRINWSILALSWATIFWVKLAYLSFFKHLVSRLPRLQLYWKVLVGFTILVFLFCILDAFLTCPKLGAAAGAIPTPESSLMLIFTAVCGHGDRLTKSLAVGALANVLDIVVDLMSKQDTSHAAEVR